MRNSARLNLSAAIMLLACGPAMADMTWSFTGPTTPGVSISGYANTGNVAGFTSLQNHQNNGAIQTIQSAAMSKYSGGVGISNSDKCPSGVTKKCDLNEGRSPEHAIDNQERYEMALLSFDAPVQLTAVKLGWASNDSDITVLAYTGLAGSGITAPNTVLGSAATNNFVGINYSSLTTKGWAAIGHYSNVGTATAKAINAGGIASSYWLIGAYNPLAINPLANPAGPTSFSSSSYDYVKLASVIGVMAAPEPGSMALVGLAGIALVIVRRRAKR